MHYSIRIKQMPLLTKHLVYFKWICMTDDLTFISYYNLIRQGCLTYDISSYIGIFASLSENYGTLLFF